MLEYQLVCHTCRAYVGEVVYRADLEADGDRLVPTSGELRGAYRSHEAKSHRVRAEPTDWPYWVIRGEAYERLDVETFGQRGERAEPGHHRQRSTRRGRTTVRYRQYPHAADAERVRDLCLHELFMQFPDVTVVDAPRKPNEGERLIVLGDWDEIRDYWRKVFQQQSPIGAYHEIRLINCFASVEEIQAFANRFHERLPDDDKRGGLSAFTVTPSDAQKHRYESGEEVTDWALQFPFRAQK